MTRENFAKTSALLFLIIFSSTAWAKVTQLQFPGKDWVLSVNTDGLVPLKNVKSPDGEAVEFAAGNRDTGLFMTVFLEKAPISGNSKKCRDFYWSKGLNAPITRTDIKKYSMGEKEIVEHMIPEFQGNKVEQKNYNVYISKDGVWIDVHISKTLFSKSDGAVIQKTIEGIAIEPAKNDSKTSVGNNHAMPSSVAMTAEDYLKEFQCGTKASKVEGKLCDLLKTLSDSSSTSGAVRSTNGYCIGEAAEIFGKNIQTPPLSRDFIKVIVKDGKVRVHWQPVKPSNADEKEELDKIISDAKNGKRPELSLELVKYLADMESKHTSVSAIEKGWFEIHASDLSARAQFTKNGIRFVHSEGIKGKDGNAQYFFGGYAWCY